MSHQALKNEMSRIEQEHKKIHGTPITIGMSEADIENLRYKLAELEKEYREVEDAAFLLERIERPGKVVSLDREAG